MPFLEDEKKESSPSLRTAATPAKLPTGWWDTPEPSESAKPAKFMDAADFDAQMEREARQARKEEAAAVEVERDLPGEVGASLVRGGLGIAKLVPQVGKIVGSDILGPVVKGITGTDLADKAFTPMIEGLEEIAEFPEWKPSKAAGGAPIDLERIVSNPREVIGQITSQIANPRFWASQLPEGALSMVPAIVGAWAPRAAAYAGKLGKALEAAQAAGNTAKVAEISSKINRLGTIGMYGAAMAMEAGQAEEKVREYESKTGETIPWGSRVASILGTGIVAGGLEAFSLGRVVPGALLGRKGTSPLAVIENILNGKGGREIVNKVLAGVATEGLTEGAQSIVENAFPRGFFDKNQKLLEGVVESMLIGAALGGLGGGAESISTHREAGAFAREGGQFSQEFQDTAARIQDSIKKAQDEYYSQFKPMLPEKPPEPALAPGVERPGPQPTALTPEEQQQAIFGGELGRIAGEQPTLAAAVDTLAPLVGGTDRAERFYDLYQQGDAATALQEFPEFSSFATEQQREAAITPAEREAARGLPSAFTGKARPTTPPPMGVTGMEAATRATTPAPEATGTPTPGSPPSPGTAASGPTTPAAPMGVTGGMAHTLATRRGEEGGAAIAEEALAPIRDQVALRDQVLDRTGGIIPQARLRRMAMQEIEGRLARGEEVEPEVLARFPELAKKYEAIAPVEAAAPVLPQEGLEVEDWAEGASPLPNAPGETEIASQKRVDAFSEGIQEGATLPQTETPEGVGVRKSLVEFTDRLSAEHNRQIEEAKAANDYEALAKISKRAGTIAKISGLHNFTDEALPDEIGKLPKWARDEWNQFLAGSTPAPTLTPTGIVQPAASEKVAPESQAGPIPKKPLPTAITGKPKKGTVAKAKPVAKHPGLPKGITGKVKVAPESRVEVKMGVQNIPTKDILTDPDRFQYKLGSEEKTGAGLALRDVGKWDEGLSGVLTLWRDPKGKLFVVNGHQRLALSKKLGVDVVRTQVLDSSEWSDKEARAYGAKINIAEGRGTEVDAAKFMRDVGITAQDLAKEGISLSEAKTRRAIALSELSDPIFHDVTIGQFSVEQAILIGENLTENHPAQNSIFTTIKAMASRGQSLSNSRLKELLMLGKSAGTTSMKQANLFGEEELMGSMLMESADLMDYAKRQLRQDVHLFSLVGRKAGRLKQAGNVIDSETNQLISKDSAEAIALVNKFAYYGNTESGKALNDFAARLNAAEGKAEAGKIRKDFYEELKRAVAEDRAGFGLGKGSRPGIGKEKPETVIAPEARAEEVKPGERRGEIQTPEITPAARLDALQTDYPDLDPKHLALVLKTFPDGPTEQIVKMAKDPKVFDQLRRQRLQKMSDSGGDSHQMQSLPGTGGLFEESAPPKHGVKYSVAPPLTPEQESSLAQGLTTNLIQSRLGTNGTVKEISDTGKHYGRGWLLTLANGQMAMVFESKEGSLHLLPGDKGLNKEYAVLGIKFKPGDKITGSHKPVSFGSVIELAKNEGPRTFDHEIWHMVEHWLLTDKERAAVIKRYGDNEELRAKAYERFNPKAAPDTIFQKILDFFRQIVKAFTGMTAEDVFAKARSGEMFGRQPNERFEGAGDLSKKAFGMKGKKNIIDEKETKHGRKGSATDDQYKGTERNDLSQIKERARRELADFRARENQADARDGRESPWQEVEFSDSLADSPGFQNFLQRAKAHGIDLVIPIKSPTINGYLHQVGNEVHLLLNENPAPRSIEQVFTHEVFHYDAQRGDPDARAILQLIDYNSEAFKSYRQKIDVAYQRAGFPLLESYVVAEELGAEFVANRLQDNSLLDAFKDKGSARDLRSSYLYKSGLKGEQSYKQGPLGERFSLANAQATLDNYHRTLMAQDPASKSLWRRFWDKDPALKASWTEMSQKAYDQVVDRFAPGERAQEKLRKAGLGLPAGEQFTSTIGFWRGQEGWNHEAVLGSGIYADQVETLGTGESFFTGATPARVGDSLFKRVDAIRDLAKTRSMENKEVFRDLRLLMVAQRDLELAGETGTRTPGEIKGVRPDESRAALQALETKYGNDFSQLQEVADGIREWADQAILQRLLQGGIITQDLYDKIKAKNQAYVPFARLMDELDQYIKSTGGGKVIKEIKGSERAIVDPFQMLIELSAKANYAYAKNRMFRSLYQMGQASPEMGIEIIKSKIVPSGMTRVDKWDPLGRSGWAMQAETPRIKKGYAFSPLAPEKGTVPFYKDGKRVWLKLPPDMYGMTQNLLPQDLGLLMRVLKWPADVLRTGAVTTPEFGLIKNPLRDLVQAWLFNRAGFSPAKWFRDLYLTLSKDPATVKMKAEMAAGGGFMATLAQSTVDEKITAADIEGKKRNIAYAAHPVEALRTLSAYLENLTRFSLYKQAREKGLPHAEAVHEARRTTLDFRRLGAHPVARYLNMIIPFWNANVQGIDKLVTELQGPNKAAVWRRLGTLTAASIGLALLFHDDDRLKELEDWEKNYFWHIPLGKTGPIIRLPKPFEAGIMFGSIPERLVEVAMGDNTTGLQAAVKAAFDVLTPETIPAILRPLVELKSNYNFFLGRPIEDAGLQNLPVELRSKPWTTPLAKAISAHGGNLIGLSPVKVEHFVRSFSGGLGANYYFPGADLLLRKAGILEDLPNPQQDAIERALGIRALFTKPPAGYRAKSVGDFFENVQEATRADQGWKLLWNTGSMDKLDAFLKDNPEAMFASLARKQMLELGKIKKKRSAIHTSKSLTSEQKRSRLDALDEKIVTLARAGNALMDPAVAAAVKMPARKGMDFESYKKMTSEFVGDAYDIIQKNLPKIIHMEEAQRQRYLIKIIRQAREEYKPVLSKPKDEAKLESPYAKATRAERARWQSVMGFRKAKPGEATGYRLKEENM